MNIKNQSRELSKMELYQLTKAPDAKTVQNCAGQMLTVKAWVLYDDADSNGEVREVLSILTDDGVIGTISTTFKRSFLDAYEIFGDDPGVVYEVVEGVSKSGRKYVDCVAREV